MSMVIPVLDGSPCPVPASPEGRLALAVMARAPSDPRGKTRLLVALGSEAGIELGLLLGGTVVTETVFGPNFLRA